MDMFSFIVAKANYWAYVILMMVGLYALIAKNNLVKKIVGMTIFQTAIILFYVSIGYKKGATIPIIQHGSGHSAGDDGAAHAIQETVTHASAAVQEAAGHASTGVQEAVAQSSAALQEAVAQGSAVLQEVAAQGSAALQEVAAHGSAALHEAATHGSDAVQAVNYINPLPHVLMLTAIVVGVATLGVALALAIKVYKEYGTVEEDEINQQLRNG